MTARVPLDELADEATGSVDDVESEASDDGGADYAAESSSDVAIDPNLEDDPSSTRDRRRVPPLTRLASYAVLGVLVVGLTAAAAYFWYHADTAREVDAIRTQSVQIATEGTIDLLSYTPDTVEAKLNAAGDRLTGSFKDSYLDLVHNTVIPGAKQKGVSANATVPAGSSVSATKDRATVMLFVNQGVTMPGDSPSQTASVVEVDLENVGGRWLISRFEPR